MESGLLQITLRKSQTTLLLPNPVTKAVKRHVCRCKRAQTKLVYRRHFKL